MTEEEGEAFEDGAPAAAGTTAGTAAGAAKE